MRHALAVRAGPVSFRIGSGWRSPIAALAQLYRDYPAADDPADFTVRLEPERPWRRWLRPSVAIHGDFVLPDAAPLPLAHGLLAAEMGMNLQMALGQRRFLLLHAASLERGGRALILTGDSGSGKSTLAALLGEANNYNIGLGSPARKWRSKSHARTSEFCVAILSINLTPSIHPAIITRVLRLDSSAT